MEQLESEDSEGTEYEVEKIVASIMDGDTIMYKVHWKNYGAQDRTWEPLSKLGNCAKLRKDFHKRFPTAVSP